MKGNAHKLIVKSALTMLPRELKDEINKKVEAGEHAGKTYGELIIYGAGIEDSASKPSPIADPKKDDWIDTIFPGDYTPYLEHFWDPYSDKGLKITGEDIGKLAGATVGSFFGPLGVITGGLIGGIIAENKSQRFRSLMERAKEYWTDWVIPKYEQKDLVNTFINLGRVCHLLADAATPAHVHNDPHPGFDLLGELNDDLSNDVLVYDDDDYEDYTSTKIKSYNNTLPSDWNIDKTSKIIYHPHWTLKDHFYNLAIITKNFDSDDCDGLIDSKPYHWDHWYDSIQNVLPIDRDITGDLSDHACDEIAKALIPTAIKFTSGLLCLFFNAVDFEFSLNVLEVTVKKIKVIDDADTFSEGEININKISIEGGATIALSEYDMDSGDTKTINKPLPPIVLNNSSDEIAFYATGYDNDDVNLLVTSIKSKDSMGSINSVITPSEIDGTKSYQFTSYGGDGKFKLYVDATLYKSTEEEDHKSKKPSKLFNNMVYKFENNEYKKVKTPIFKNTEEINRLNKLEEEYKPDKRYTTYVNMKSMERHGLNSSKQPCGHWRNINDQDQFIFKGPEATIFLEDVNGDSIFKKELKKRYGENSIIYKKNSQCKSFNYNCSCIDIRDQLSFISDEKFKLSWLETKYGKRNKALNEIIKSINDEVKVITKVIKDLKPEDEISINGNKKLSQYDSLLSKYSLEQTQSDHIVSYVREKLPSISEKYDIIKKEYDKKY